MNVNVNTEALSVTDVNRYIKMLVSSDEVLSAIAIRGEISNFKRHSSGHMYFTLKDEGSEIAAVMFRGDTGRLAFVPTDGMRVVAYGSVDVYEKSGRYQVYVRTMTSDGVGAMARAYERLKLKLAAEGLFDEDRKRPLPKFPSCIGVITAPTGAAIRDILNITGRRYPEARVLIFPSLVQGADAPASLCMGLQCLNAYGGCDVIIIGRGGGSIEDLWAFNDEGLVRAVAASEIPVISAVGHETDFTLCDFAADKRAPTPSAAAEIAVPDRTALLSALADAEERLYGGVCGAIGRSRERVSHLEREVASRSPHQRLSRLREQVGYNKERIDRLIDRKYTAIAAEYGGLIQSLEALNPLAVLQRGYSAVRAEDGRIAGGIGAITAGDRVTILMRDGEALAEVLSVNENKGICGGQINVCEENK